MPDYTKGKIYKLHILGNDELIYYGSTTTKLSDRIAKHRAKFKRWKNGKSNYLTSFKLFENENVIITLVEKYPCSCKYELEAKERFYIENNKCVNKRIPIRTKKEYYKANADKIKEYRKSNADKIKEYYKANADKIKKQTKEYREKNADKIKEHYKKNADKIKEYYKANADKLKEYQNKYRKTNADKIKEYYQNNKEAILQKMKEKIKEKIKCEFCGCSIRKSSLKRHQRSTKCKKFQ